MLDIEHYVLGLQFHNLRLMRPRDCEMADLYFPCLLAVDVLNLADRFVTLRHAVVQFEECFTVE